jgi:ATP-dependent DNA helicase MPH1
MLQRMGRTGRKRAGNIVLLLMKGKEEEKFMEAKDSYQKMQQLICNGDSFTFRHDLSARIVPRDVRPEVDKRHVDIPIENSQDPSLPEPKKTPARLRKKPAKKKFNMPDDVETGFVKASFFSRPVGQTAKAPKQPAEMDFLADVPELEKVLLSKSQADRFERLYKSVPKAPFAEVQELGFDDLNLGAHPAAQRRLRRTVHLKHGEYTKRCVGLFRALGRRQDSSRQPPAQPYGETDCTSWEQLPIPPFADEPEGVTIQSGCKAPSSAVGRQRVAGGGPAPKGAGSNKAGRKRAAEADLFAGCEEAEDDDDDDEDESSDTATGEATPAGRGGGRSRGWRRAKRGQGGGLKRVGDHLEDVGDDCTRTSDLEDTDGSDSGADLADFIVGDGVFTPSNRRRSTGPSTPGSSNVSLAHRRAGEAVDTAGERPFYEPMQFGPTQDSDDEMPDVDELVARSTSAKKVAARPKARTTYLEDKEDEDDDKVDGLPRLSPRKPPAKRRRQVLADSDDE